MRPSRIALAGAVVALLAAACVPLVDDTPPAAPLAPPPPSVGLPADSPALTINRAYVTGLSQAWDIAFAPDGTLLYTEKAGTVSRFSGGVKTLLGSVAGSTINGEGGLMGLAVDPDFATNHFAYVCTTTATDNRLVRLTLDLAAATGAGITAQAAIRTGMPRSNFHNGCRVRFQPGTRDLFWSMGDAGIGTAPQSLQSFGGKILKATVLADGTLQPAGMLGGYVYSYGHRNPQGLAFRPGTNDLYTAEHGPGVNDEVNRPTSGANGGWDPIPGYSQGTPMTDLAKFPNAMRPLWRSGDIRTIAPSGMTFLSGQQWKSWDGAIVLSVLKDSELRLLLTNPDGTISGQLQIGGSTGTRLRSVVQGPDGFLYVAEDVGGGAGQLWQVVPS